MMNRSIKGANNGVSSKASSSTLCQKCLKKGHYSYECKTAAQERPYVSRPSRTQQLLHPKLIPKLSNEVPQDLLRKEGIADEQLAKLKEERSRKKSSQNIEPARGNEFKRPRSASLSSVSVSTISTRSPISPQPHSRKLPTTDTSQGQSQLEKPTSIIKHASSKRKSPSVQRRNFRSSDRKRSRRSYSRTASLTSDDDHTNRHLSSRRNRSMTPPKRGKSPRSKTPFKSQVNNGSNERHDSQEKFRENNPNLKGDKISPQKERSLSPFSKRLALTQAMNMNR